MNLLLAKQAEQINEVLKALQRDEDRLEFIEAMIDGICPYCGAVRDYCYCRNDD